MDIAAQVESLLTPILAQNQFELVELQYRREAGGWVLRIFVDRVALTGKKGAGVTLADCEKVSRIVGEVLDGADFLSASYNLEVSSPGINRALRTESHFKSHVGQPAKVSITAPLGASPQKNFTGKIVSCENQSVVLDDVVSGKVEIPISAIAKAHLNLI